MEWSPLHSPALNHRTPAYPAAWLDRVPLTVRVLFTYGRARADAEYDAYVSECGEVSAIVEGRLVPLPAGRFEVVAWHDEEEGESDGGL